MIKLSFFLMPLYAILIGCGESHQANEPPQSAISQGDVEFVLTYTPPDADTSQTNKVSNPTDNDIEKAFSKIDWPNAGPWQASGSISTYEPYFMALKVTGTSSEGVALQFSEEPDPDGKWIHQFASVVPIDDAIRAFQSFARKQEDFRTMIVWEESE